MDQVDVLIVGGGPAGMSAALVLLRARRSVAIVDAGHPRNAPAAHMHGFLSRDGMPPADFRTAGRAELARYGGVVIDGTVVSLAPGFEARFADGSALRARRVLIATGLQDVLPEIAGVRERWGRDLLHCPYCHGYEVRDQPIGVLGGTVEAVQHGLLLRQWSADIVLFPGADVLDDGHREALEARGVRIVIGEVDGLAVENDRLVGVRLGDGTVVPRTAVFVRPRFIPNADLLAGLGCDTDARGWPVHDATGRTTVAGVWVAGNAADPRAQVITAAGEGSAAAISLNADLVDEDVAIAIARHRAAAGAPAPSH
jgi:thioredoxin reductase